MSAWERHLARMVNGTVQLGPRHWHWLWESKEGRTVIARLFLTVGAGWAMYRLAGAWPWLWGAAVVLVLVRGYRSAEEEELAGAEEAEDEVSEDGEPELSPDDIRQLLIDSIRHLADGRAGIHLEELRTDWLDDGLDMDLSEFRRWVESHGLHVDDSVKSRGKTRIGIRLAALPAEAAATPPPVAPDDLFQDW